MENTFTIIGIDPGNNLGVSIFTLDHDLNILSIQPITYRLDTYFFTISTNEMVNKLYYIKSIITNLIYTYEPLVISIESAFMNSRFPKAVMTLSQYVGTIELTIKELNNFIKIFKYAPKYVKSIICKGDANKDDMLNNIVKIEEIAKVLDTTSTTEHSIDATAICYTGLLHIRQYPYLLCSLV